MFKKPLALILALAIVLVSLPLSMLTASAAETGSVNGVNYTVGEVIYQSNFANDTVGSLPSGWSAGYPAGSGANKTSFGWNSSNASLKAAKVVNHGTLGKVVEFTAANTDAFIAAPSTGTMNYIFEAEVVPNASTSLGIANNYYAPTNEASGTMYAVWQVNSRGITVNYRGNSTTSPATSTASLPVTPAMGSAIRFKLISLNGFNYIFCNDTLVATAPWRTPTGSSDNPGFYTYNGSLYIKNVKVTSLFSSTKFEATRVIANNDSTVDIETEYSFDKNQPMFHNYFANGTYSYAENGDFKLGVATTLSAEDQSTTLTMDTAGAQAHFFTSDEFVQDTASVYISSVMEDVNPADFGKYINFRPFVWCDGNYYYGIGKSYKVASLANGAYLSAASDNTKDIIDTLFADYSDYVVGVNADDITFTLFSDFHYKENMYPNSVADLKTILKRADDNNSQLVISGGDFCNDFKGSPELFNAFLGYTTEEGELLTTMNIYGNHELETAGNTMEVVTPLLTNASNAVWGDGTVGSEPEDKSYGYYYVDVDGFRFIALDNQYSWNPNHINGEVVGWDHSLEGSYGPPSAADNAARGFDEGMNAQKNSQHYSIGAEQLEWFEDVTMDAVEKDLKCIMISHLGYSFLAWNGGGTGGTEIRAVTAKANEEKPGSFLMGISGHFHTYNTGWNKNMLFIDTNTVRNVHTDGPRQDHYTNEHTYKYEAYDDEGNLLSITDRPLNELYWSGQCWFSEDPLSANITLNTAGIIEIEGVMSDWWYGVEPGAAQQAIIDGNYGNTPYIESKLFSDCEKYGHVETRVEDGDGHRVACRVDGCPYEAPIAEEHSYTEKVETNDYLANKVDCLSPAMYFYSCACGKASSQFFVSEEAIGHDESAVWSSDSTHHWHECNDCDEDVGKAEHTFDKKVTTANFLAYTTDCASTSYYYYSCVCGEKGSDTFKSVNSALHDKESEWTTDATGHWHACTNCDMKTDYAEHTFDRQIKTPEYIAVPEDSQGTTVYYYACECGYKGSETYEISVPKPGSVWDGTLIEPTRGSGTETDPYLISVAQELAYVVGLSSEETAGKYYKITDDIIINDIANAQGAYDANGYPQLYAALPWPSGQALDHSLTRFGTFSGSIDGGGNKIIGLYNEWAPNGDWGLFARLGPNAKVKNINVDSAFYRRGNQSGTWGWSNTWAAGIAGQTAGGNVTIENCTVYRSTITENANGWGSYSGILCRNPGFGGVKIVNCGTDLKLGLAKSGFYCGGILGDTWGNTLSISNSWSNYYLAGGNNANGGAVTYENCYTLNAGKCASVTSGVPTGLTVVSGSVKGEAAKTTMPGLDWTNGWQTVANSNPLPLVPREPTVITMAGTMELVIGDTATLGAVVTPAEKAGTILWSSDNTLVADVDGNGNISTLAIGTATITATLESDPTVTAQCVVTVTGIDNNYADISEEGWYFEAVSYAVNTGIMKGYENGLFGTSDSIQRQDFLVMLARYAGVDLAEYATMECRFNDVAADSYYEAAVIWGSEHGIVTGYDDGRFGVGDTITREQMVTFLCRYARYIGLDTTVDANRADAICEQYEDIENVSEFAFEAVLWAVDRGVISGKTPTTIVPQGDAQRCEVAKVILNIDQRAIFEEEVNTPEPPVTPPGQLPEIEA